MLAYVSKVKTLKKRTKKIIGIVAIAAFLAFIFWPSADDASTAPESTVPVVEVITPAQFAGENTISLIGTVRAFSEAAVTAERAGRVTSVPVRLGDTVGAGQIIATLENASEQAAVLQAEGSYEAALAAAAQNQVGTVEAENGLLSARNNAVSTYKTAYGSVNNTILTTIDPFFSQPNSTNPGLRIDGRGFTDTLNAERVAFQNILPVWQANTGLITTASDLESELAYADTIVAQTIRFLDTFITIFNQQDGSSRYTDAELIGFIAEFTAARGSLISTQSAINNAETQLIAAEEALERAQLAASGGQNSAADAQVKQALGGLRSAQSNLAKTIIRSPIAGTINTLEVRTGDFIGAQQQVAEVANNDALEVVTAIGEQERDALALGDTVTLEGGLSGTVTEIAPAVDQGTGKIEVRIAAESPELKNGDTVTITRTATTTVDSRVFVPLSAVKFEQTDGFVFLVENNRLVARAVTLGVVRGSSVEVLDGLTNAETIVKDARGLQTDAEVEIIGSDVPGIGGGQ